MNFKFWLMKKLIGHFWNYAKNHDDHIVADNVIVMQDAIAEIERRCEYNG